MKEGIVSFFFPLQTVKKFRLPLPMVTIIQAGRGSSGKFRCVKDFMVVPSPTMPLKEVMCMWSKRGLIWTSAHSNYIGG